MIQFFQKTKGTVTVFLILILVPVIAICTIFVDASRVKLAQGVAVSSADLALNTVLTQYDEELSDYYGLMASSQSIDEFYDVSEQYFVSCMVSQGVSVTLAQEFAEDISAIVKGKANINDFIGIDTTETTVEIKEVDNANLANPAMMKEEIVEFMKYRGPIELLGSVDSPNGFAYKLEKVKDNIKNMPAETEVQDLKTDYYMKENELLEAALEVYETLRKYEKYAPAGETAFDKSYLEDKVKSEMGAKGSETNPEGLIKSYKELHRKYVSNWANTKNRTKITSVATRVAAESYSVSGSNINASSVIGAISECETAKNNFESARTTLNNAISQIPFATYSSSEVNHIQYWVQMEDKIVKGSQGDIYKKYTDALIALKKAQAKMSHYYTNIETKKTVPVIDPTTNQPKKDPLTGLTVYQEIDYDYTQDEYSSGVTIASKYSSVNSDAATSVSKYTTDSIYNISANMESFSTEATDSTKPNNIDRTVALNEIKAAVSTLKKQYDEIVKAQGLLNDVIVLLPNVVTLTEQYKEAFDDWSDKVDEYKDYNSDVIKQDYYEIQTIKQSGEEVPEEYKEGIEGNTSLVRVDISADDVEAFQEKLQSTYDMLDTYRRAIESVKYRGVQIFGTDVDSKAVGGKGIYSFAQLESAATGTGCAAPAVKKEDIPVKQSELDTYINNTWSIESNFTQLNSIGEIKADSNNPVLHNYLIGASDSRIAPFDGWLHEKFTENPKTLEDAKGIIKKFKKMMKKLKDGALTEYGSYDHIYHEDDVNITGSDLPSKDVDPDTESVFTEEEDNSDDSLQNTLSSSSNVGGLFNNFNIDNLLFNGRDNLYTTEYIMKMFSYKTSAVENIYKINADPKGDNFYNMKDGDIIKPKTAGGYYDDPLREAESETASWWNTKKTFTENKTLTNKMINKDNNISYGNEVEYILYGGTNSENKKKIELTLFFTRYALNLPPVLSKYWNDNGVKAIADAISAATQGIIPAPLVKLIIVLGVNAAESAVDKQYLLAGLPVAFVKDKDSLFISLDTQSLVDAVSDGVEGYASGLMSSANTTKKPVIAFTYSDYLSMFLFISLCASPDGVYKRTADVIQVTMDQRNSGFLMVNSRTYFTLDSSVRVKPMMMTLPYAQQSGVEVLDTDTWNKFTYKLTKGY